MTSDMPTPDEDQENPGGTSPPDDTEVDTDAGSPAPEREKDDGGPAPSGDDQLPAPTPGM